MTDLVTEAAELLGTDRLRLTITGTWIVACPEGSIDRSGRVVIDFERADD